MSPPRLLVVAIVVEALRDAAAQSACMTSPLSVDLAFAFVLAYLCEFLTAKATPKG